MNTDKELSAGVNAGASVLRGIEKYVGSNVGTSATLLRGTNKMLSGNVIANASIRRSIGKKATTSIGASVSAKKSTGKNITTSVSLTGAILKNTATLTLVYNGNAELGLGAQEGSQFNIIVAGTFTVFTIAMNGKTLTYTENCVDQTIIIDNINATVKNVTVNKLSKVTGDVADFLKLIPGDNIITTTKIGENVDFKFDFRPQYI